MTRPPLLRASYDLLPGELVVDNFAGGGGASTGIEAAIGRPVDFAINHSPEAIAVHKANHPETRHFCENILEVDPVAACGGRPVGLAWFSPDCTHFSRAKGTQPVKREIRGLAWVVIRWAKAVRPRIIVLENVEEFQTWGPLGDDSRPDPERIGETFREWLAELAACGYSIEFTSLVAADYGTPTTRKRLFLVARRDQGGITWPEPSHGRGRPESWRPAAEVIDWSLPCPSIFERSRPLAEATQRRIAQGIRRYVVDAKDPGPFIVRHGHYSHRTGAGIREGCGAGTFRGQSLGLPLSTVCATNDKHIVCPIVTKHYGGVVGHGVDRTLGTITARDHHALSVAHLSRLHDTTRSSSGNGRSRGDRGAAGRDRVEVSQRARHFAGRSAKDGDPRQVRLFDREGVLGWPAIRGDGPSPGLDGDAWRDSRGRGPQPSGWERAQQRSDEPGDRHEVGEHSARVDRWPAEADRHAARRGRSSEDAEGGRAIVRADCCCPGCLANHRIPSREAEVTAFLIKWYGADAGQQQSLFDPLHTVTTKARFGLVTVAGEAYEIVDIGMRMLQPHELFAAQGFPDDYQIAPTFNGKPLTKTAQIALAGNSVCPQVAAAVVSEQIRRAA